MEKRPWIFLLSMIVLIIALFIRGYYINKERFHEEAKGILVSKKKGWRASYIIKLYNSNTNNYTEHIYGYANAFEMLKIGDSIVKNRNSYILNVYTRKSGVFCLKNSFEMSHY